METFEETLRNIGSTLKELQILTNTGAALADTVLPSSCYQHWGQIASTHAILEPSISLLEIRDEAYKSMVSLTKGKEQLNLESRPERDKNILDPVRYGSIVVSFATARYLSLSSYMSTTWALYDQLTVVAGKLIGPKNFANMRTKKRCPKLPSAFFDMKEKLPDSAEEDTKEGKTENLPRGFSLDCVIGEKWKWPVFLSYRIRNLVLHDGVGKTNDSFFQSENRISGFCLSEPIQKNLVREFCFATGRQPDVSQEEINQKFPTSDLRVILKQNNEEIDALLERLLLWGTDAFKSQIQLFSEPDKDRLFIPRSGEPSIQHGFRSFFERIFAK